MQHEQGMRKMRIEGSAPTGASGPGSRLADMVVHLTEGNANLGADARVAGYGADTAKAESSSSPPRWRLFGLLVAVFLLLLTVALAQWGSLSLGKEPEPSRPALAPGLSPVRQPGSTTKDAAGAGPHGEQQQKDRCWRA